MNRDEIVDLLTAVAVGDHRTVGQTDVDLWHAVLADIPKDAAISALVAHRREQPGVWLEAGHIYQRVRAYVRDQLDREPESAREARQDALAAKAAEDFELLAERKGLPSAEPPKFKRPEFNPLLVRCPWCHVGPGQRCQVPGTSVLLTPKLHEATHGAHPARWDAVRNAEKGATA